MGVDLGGLDAGMAQQLLQHAQIGDAGMHAVGEGMAQHVRRHSLRAGKACRNGSLLDLEQGRLAGQGLGAVADRMNQPRGGRSVGIGASKLLSRANGPDSSLVYGTSGCLSPSSRTTCMRVPGGVASDSIDSASRMRMPEA